MTLMYWTAHMFLIPLPISAASLFMSVGSFGSTNVFLGSTTKDHFSQPCDQCLGSSQHPSRSWNTSDPSHQSSPVPISSGTAVSQGHFHAGDSTRLGTGIPALLIFCLLVTIQDMYQLRAGRTVGGSRLGVTQTYFLCARWFGTTAILCLSTSVQNP